MTVENRSLVSQLDDIKSESKRLREDNETLRLKFQQLNDSLHKELQEMVEKSFSNSDRQVPAEAAAGRQGG